MARPISYLKAIVICHGKSEVQIFNFIKSNLRLKLEVESDKKGEKSIQITSIHHTLEGGKFNTFENFTRAFEDAEIVRVKTKKRLSDTFKLFIIMDTEDCTEEQRRDYMNKNMFRKYWLYDYIVPIWYIPKLEPVLIKAGIQFEKKGDGCKKEYIKIFPTDKKYKTKDTLQIQEFRDALKTCRETNMNEFISFCLENAPSISNQ